MSECTVCGNESGKGKTCSSKCRKILSRSVTKGVTDASVTSSVTVIGKPGDTDYNGCMIEVDGVWQQKPKHDIPLADYSREMLDIGLQSYRGDTWINSPEHKELMQRLSSMTIDELIAGGYSVPAWKRAQVVA